MASQSTVRASWPTVTGVTVAVLLTLGAVGPSEQLFGRLPAVLLSAVDGAPVDMGVVSKAAQAPWPEIRQQVAELLAARADPADVPMVVLLARDRDLRVRAAAMLAAGRIGRPAAEAVASRLAGTSALERQAAAWAACRIKDPALHRGVLKRLAVETDTGVLETILGNLWRLDTSLGWASRCSRWAAHELPGLRRAAAYSLARADTEVPSPQLRRLAHDPQPVIRLTALRGMARRTVDEAAATAAMAALLDPDWRVRAAGCEVLARTAAAELSEPTHDALIAAARSVHPHLVVAAVRTFAAQPEWDDDGVLQSWLEATDEPWFAEEALLARAARGSKGIVATVSAWTGSDHLWRRVAAARALAQLPTQDAASLLDTALADPATAVRVTAVESAGALGAAEPLLRVIRKDSDPVVRAAAVRALCQSAPLPAKRLLELYRSWGAGQAEAAALRCLLEHAPESEEAAAALEAAERDASPLVRAVVASFRRSRGEPLGVRREASHGHQWYERLMAWRGEKHWLDVVTVRGTFRCRLDTARTPITTRELVTLAEKGAYDGLTFHRVVPSFVVQGGDPRGDGWGNAGVVVPDEPSLVPFDSWRVGVATDGPGTGGSQLFVTLAPADHLTGAYTNVGEVTAGRDVCERLRRWDRILRVVHHTGDPEPLRPTLVGTVDWQELAVLPGWQEAYDAYTPDPATVRQLQERAVEGRIVVVLGTWCADSQREVPRLRAVLDALGDAVELETTLYAVDRSKRIADPSVNEPLVPTREVDRVATIIVADGDGSELGRVVETPPRPIEDVLLELYSAGSSDE
jgi:cyclophilin family peptidyl-prolyl cis-trans isomerase/HEAT repeat protein